MVMIQTGTRQFLKDRHPFFYLADTCWSAFTNIEERDWEYYLDWRKAQGFNVVQVNMLQQWDASQTHLNIKPFAVKEDGTFDFSTYNEVYFERAYRMFAAAEKRDITIALVLLWSNYVPDTWASQMSIKQLGLFPKAMIDSYVDKVMGLYDQFNPIYVISGDTDFQTKEVIEEYYGRTLNRVKYNNSKALTTLHIRGREADLPEVLKSNPNLDFYMFQSGHNSAFQAMTYQLAESFYQMEPKRPSLNSEPCYEMMGYSRWVYGRFSREDVRKAAWQSVLAGGTSGITYGAHGIWSWHNNHLGFDSRIGEAFENPYDWHDALQFKGAWDYSYLKDFLESNLLLDLQPAQELLQNETSEIRVAQNDRKILVYIPSNITIKLSGDFSHSEMAHLDLESKEKMTVVATYASESNQTQVPMHRFTRDALLIIEK